MVWVMTAKTHYSMNIVYIRLHYVIIIIIIIIITIILSTAVEKVVACALVTQRARVRSPVGTSFLGEVFFGFFPYV